MAERETDPRWKGWRRGVGGLFSQICRPTRCNKQRQLPDSDVKDHFLAERPTGRTLVYLGDEWKEFDIQSGHKRTDLETLCRKEMYPSLSLRKTLIHQGLYLPCR